MGGQKNPQFQQIIEFQKKPGGTVVEERIWGKQSQHPGKPRAEIGCYRGFLNRLENSQRREEKDYEKQHSEGG